MAITTATIITADSYNTIQGNVSSVLRDYYKYPSESIQINEGMRIDDEHWLKLYRDINRCRVHQTGQAMDVTGITLPSQGEVVKANFCNLLDQTSFQIGQNKDLIHSSQISEETTIDTRVSSWMTTIRTVAYFTWTDSDAAISYFNLGGKINVNLSYSGSDGSGWITRIQNANFDLTTNSNNFFDRDKYVYDEAVTYNNNSIAVTINRLSSSQIKVEVIFTPLNSSTINVLPIVTIRSNRSKDNYLTNTSLAAGVNSPSPQPLITVSMETGGEVQQPTVPIRNLKITPSSLTFNTDTDSESTPQAITLTNLGGTSILNITDIYSTSNGVTARFVFYPEIFTDFPILIAPDESFSFEVAYSGSTVGNFNNSIIFVSNDSIATTSNIPVTTVVTQAPFNFTLSPDVWEFTTSSLSSQLQTFSINANQSFSSYSATLSNTYDGAFVLTTNSLDGPKVKFVPTTLSSGSYNTNLEVTVNGVSRTVSISIVFTATQTVNLSKWISAQSYYNSAVGFSYDIISGVRYLTIGIGAGSEGSSVTSVSTSYLLTDNLSYGADTGFQNGPVLYDVNYGGSWSAFMQTYGAWIKYNSNTPTGMEWDRAYTITVPTSDSYTWQFAVDDTGWFTIDDIVIGDLRNTGGSFNSYYSGTTTLSAGTHILRIYATNQTGSGDNPGGLGLKISRQSDNLVIWSTVAPQRTGSLPYLYWDEVYRIPLVHGAYTYHSANYLMKASTSIPPGNNYGDYFGSGTTAGSIFSITDDGYGNLTIVMNEKTKSSYTIIHESTLKSLVYAMYYYTNNYPYTRYTQVENPVNGQTKFLTGISASGNIKTITTSIPGQ